MYLIFKFVAIALVLTNGTHLVTLHARVYIVILEFGEQCVSVESFFLSKKRRDNHTHEHVQNELGAN